MLLFLVLFRIFSKKSKRQHAHHRSPSAVLERKRKMYGMDVVSPPPKYYQTSAKTKRLMLMCPAEQYVELVDDLYVGAF